MCGRERPCLEQSIRHPRWIERTNQCADRETIETRGVGVRPRVGGIDGGSNLQQFLVEAREARKVCLRQPVLAEVRALEHVVAVHPGLVGVAGHDRETELGSELEVSVMDRADDLAAHL